MLNLTKTGVRINGKEYYGVMNPNLILFFFNMWEEELDRNEGMSACGLQWNMEEGLSWFGPSFLPVVLAILSVLMGSWILKSTGKF